jgi:hypothetical protein
MATVQGHPSGFVYNLGLSWQTKSRFSGSGNHREGSAWL